MSRPQAATDPRSLPESRVRPRGHQPAGGVRGGTGLRDDDPIRRHERLRNRDRLAFSSVHADEIAHSDVVGQLRDAGDREVRAVADRIDRGVLHDDPRQMPEEVLDGPQERADGRLVAIFLPVRERVPERVQRMGVRLAERRGAGPAQVDQVRADAEGIADVRAQSANVGAGFTPHPEKDVPAIDLEQLELDGRNVLFRVRCESGTYIRTLCADIGDALGVGANMVDLRRTRAATFGEADAHPLNAFRDAIAYWKEDGDDTPVRAILRPVEDLLRHLPRMIIKDTAVDALCHGANLAVPGVAKLSEHIRVGDLVGVYTGKGEAVAIAKALMTSDRIVIAKSGAAADTDRVLMAPGTYPRLWK